MAASEEKGGASGFKELPEGCRTTFLSENECAKLGLLTKDFPDPYETKFPIEDVKKNLVSLGAMSPWAPLKDDLMAYPDDELLLVVGDADMLYSDDGWVICVTVAARDKWLSAAIEEAKAKAEALAAKLAAEEAARKKKEAEATAVWEETPIIAKKYQSDTVDETAAEIAAYTQPNNRPLFVLALSKKRSEYGCPYKFSNYEADTTVTEFRSKVNPNFELNMCEVDWGLQAPGPSAFSYMSDKKVQTTSNAKTNRSIQYESNKSKDTEKEATIESPGFIDFLQRATFACEYVLQQNETVNLYKEELGAISDTAISLKKNAENEAKILRSFSHLVYSKGRCISSVDWHPVVKGVVLVTCTNNDTFDERTNKAGRSSVSYNLIWNFRDLLHPQNVLETPHETFKCLFNPINPDIIVGGTITGQVVMWNVASLKKEEKTKHDDDGDPKPLMYEMLSSIDYSHSRAVSDLCWMPDCTEVDSKGNISVNPDGKIYQFITVSTDGQLLIWDLRHKKAIRKPGKRSRKAEQEAELWVPIFGVKMTDTTGTGGMNTYKFTLKGPGNCGANFYCGTSNGEIVAGNWNFTPGASKKTSEEENGSGGGNDGQLKYIKWSARDHFRPCVALERSPFFGDIILSVGDWGFNIWKEGEKEPIYTSPNADSYVTSGKWSPTRAGVILIAKRSGDIDAWDLTYSSHRPLQVIHVGTLPVTSINFWHHGGKDGSGKQLLAAGDIGAMHVIEMPRNLRTRSSHANEAALMQAYLDRETKQLAYTRMRRTEREYEKQKLDEAAAAAENVDNSKEINMAKEQAKEDTEAEKEYRAIEAKFRQMFGLQDN